MDQPVLLTRIGIVKRMLVVVLFGLALVGGVRAAVPSSPLLALTGGGLRSDSRLVALEPRTLEPRGSIALPGWAFGRESARSPDGAHLALVPKPSETDERLFVVGLRDSLRVVTRVPFPGEDVCRLAWPSTSRLLVVLTRGPCYRRIASARVIVLDPFRAHVVARYRLSGAATVVATAQAPGGLAVLLTGRWSGARLILISETGLRSISLPRLQTRPRPLDKSMLAGAVGLAVDGEHAYVVEPGRLIAVGLTSGEIKVGPLGRMPAGSLVQVLPVRRGVLAITGTSRGGRSPLGLRLVEVRDCRVQMVDPSATGIALAGSTLLAFQPSFGRLARGTPAIGLRGYNLDGSIRFSAFAGRPIVGARAENGYAYVAGPGRGELSVVDPAEGRIEPPHPGAMPISFAELLL
jgi:hypothetical protein